jgi:predicted enzyme related to lactoylglutathione lyase
MPEYSPGTPSWVELSSRDADASAVFYRDLMGWSTTKPGPGEETGGYRRFQQDGQDVAGLMGIDRDGQPTAWATYVTVADADAAANKVRAAGGGVIGEPMDVMEMGRMAHFLDPSGAAFGVWQPRTFIGADLVNEPNSLCWNELLTRDSEAGRKFYPALFGWVPGRPSFEGAPDSYTVWELGGRPVGGMMQMTDEYFPPEVPPHWGVCFAVADCDATVAKARELGATITAEPMDMPIGRLAVMIDPQGASLSVMQLTTAG